MDGIRGWIGSGLESEKLECCLKEFNEGRVPGISVAADPNSALVDTFRCTLNHKTTPIFNKTE